MNKNVNSLSELINGLCAAEGILKTKGTVNLTPASTSKPKSKGNGGWKKKKKADRKSKQVALRVAKGSTQAGNSKPKGKCFHCGEDGHWKRNCSKFLASKKQGMLKSLLFESCLVLNPTNSWCVDSGSTNHICNMLQQRFKETRKLSDEEMYLRLGDDTTVQVLAIENFTLHFNTRVLILENCLYVLAIHRNLIFVTILGQQGYSTSLKDIVVIKKDKTFICTGTIIDGLYIVTLDAYELKNSVLDSNSHVLPKKRKFSTFNKAYLWHLRLGHINPNRIQRLIKDGLLEPLDLESLLVCESCLEGKMTKRPFTAKGYEPIMC